ncbi:MerR family transcriptional regulator [Paractinoplanes deccanensis]|nr:MerR family transcriptional regulator [Actinoplanes deccanensis]
MRMAQLAERSGIAIPTIKYYLRAGLVPPGRVTARNQAEYTEGHLRRLRLVDTLLTVGGFPVTAARAILAAVDDVRVPSRELIETVQAAARAGRARVVGDDLRERAEATVSASLGAGPAPLDRLVEACAVADLLGAPGLGAALEQYAAAARTSAACDDAVLRAYVARAQRTPPERDPAVREAVVVVLVLGAVVRSALVSAAQRELLTPRLTGAATGPAQFQGMTGNQPYPKSEGTRRSQ